MPLNALPVTPGELETLQSGTTFTTNTGQATSQAALINLDNGVDTVASYAAALLNANIATSQVAMATTCLMWGETQDPAFLTNTATVAAPLFIALAVQLGTNQVTTAAEGVGVALANDAQFAPFLALNETQFAAAVGAETGVNVGVITGWLAAWIDFYTTFGTPAPGVTVQEAAYGATFGDAIGVALQNPTSANLQTVTSTNAQGETVIEGKVANDLLTIATGQYVVGIDCDLLPEHTLLQGEAGSSGLLRLTIGQDTPPAFETSIAGAVFDATPAGNPPLGQDNTLNVGDHLVSTVGDATLEFTAIDSFFGSNPPFAQGVTMEGIATANITNLADDEIAGFAGDITGLTTVTLEGGSEIFGDVQVGDDGAGLNTPLETLNINAGEFDLGPFGVNDGADFNLWIESAAFAGGEALDLNLGGVGTFVDLNVTGGDAFYETVNVHSLEDDNHVDLDTNAETIATITVDGAEALRICGTALNQDTLTTFDASAAGGNVTAIFEGPEGGVAVTGGAGDDNFWFLTTDFGQGETTFTTDDTVDGGAGDNTLTLQAFEGDLLGTDVGANITNITTIVHSTESDPCFIFGAFCDPLQMQGDLSVDMAESGSATVLDLNGWYDVFSVEVTNLENDDTVIYSGFGDFFGQIDPPGSDFGLQELTLETTSATGIANLVMDQDPCIPGFLENNFGFTDPFDHRIEDLIVENGLLLTIDSIGDAPHNVIFNLDQIATDIEATGTTDLSLGGILFDDPGTIADFDVDEGAAYAISGGTINASALDADLYVAIEGNFGDPGVTVFGGLGDNFVDVFDQDESPHRIVLTEDSGNDIVKFHDETFDAGFTLGDGNYTTVENFGQADDIIGIDANDFGVETTQGIVVAEGDDPLIFDYANGTVADATTDAFNFIKATDPVSVGGGTAQFGFDAVFGALGSILVTPGTVNVLFAYYDSTNQEMVLGTADEGFAGFIGSSTTIGSDFDVIAEVQMSLTDYNNFNADNLLFLA